MEQTVVSVGLPVGETLEIKKQRFEPVGGKGMKRISVVTGTHGDELEGQYVCYLLLSRLRENMKDLKGIVDVYPALNPLGIDSITRGIPGFDLDMNRIYPGSKDGSMYEYIASGIVNDLKGSSVCIDIHASNIFLTEIPQVRISRENERTLVPLARKLNCDYIWVHPSATVLEATLAYTMNSIGVPTLVVEMGVGMRITKKYCEQLVDGIFALMKDLGIWEGEAIEPREPLISSDDSQVAFINAGESGIFIPDKGHWEEVQKGEHIGDIVNPLLGEVAESILSPCDGIIFTLREYPVVDEGSLVARILKRGEENA